jgi:hypothetical protein
MSTADRAFAFDYEHSGKLDHICVYRPGSGLFGVVERISKDNAPTAFNTVFKSSGNGIGGFDLKYSGDQVMAFDYDGSGKADHLVLFRPGHGVIYILEHVGNRNEPTGFISLYESGSGIGENQGQHHNHYDLKGNTDRMFAFDFKGVGVADHVFLYRAGHGVIWILQKQAQKVWVRVSESGALGEGIISGTDQYDLLDQEDRAFAFDFNSSGKEDHFCFYRPGHKVIWFFTER